jgi:hypothetical protein
VCIKGDCCKQGKSNLYFTQLVHTFTQLVHTFTQLVHTFTQLVHTFTQLVHTFTRLVHTFTLTGYKSNIYPIIYFRLLTHTIGPASIMKDRWKFFECKRCSNYCRSDRFNKEEGRCKKDCQPYLSQEALNQVPDEPMEVELRDD